MIEWSDDEFDVFPEQKCEKEEEIPEVKWHPVSNIDKIYENLPKAKQFHENYVKLWLGGRND